MMYAHDPERALANLYICVYASKSGHASATSACVFLDRSQTAVRAQLGEWWRNILPVVSANLRYGESGAGSDKERVRTPWSV